MSEDNRFRHNLTSLQSLDRRISPFLSSDRPIWSSSSSAVTFLSSVDSLISLIDSNSLPTAADDLIHLSMIRLGQEFKALINIENGNSYNEEEEEEEEEERDVHGDGGDGEQDVIPVACAVTDYDVIIDALPSGTIADMNSIAKRMVSGRYATECCHVYSACRKNFLEESLSRLGLNRHLTLDDIHNMTWPELEDEIERWRNVAAVSLRILFPSERRLSDRVFLGLSAAADLAFAESCREAAVRVLSFADAIAVGSRAPERLFKVLDMYETVRDLIPEFNSVFSDQYCVILKNEAVSIWKRLGEAIRGVFMELENLIRRDPAKVAVPGGRPHPITRYVMNYLRAACRSRRTLEQVFEESSLSVQMGWIMELLESNLEAKSKLYKDPGLFSVFMMNNGRYIVQKVKDNELGSLLGDDWIRKHSAKVQQYHMNYQRKSWSKVLGLLKFDSGDLASNGGSRVMKEKLTTFNACFDEICKTQSTWVFFDDQLKEELRISVLGNLSLPYMTFLKRFLAFPDIGKHDRNIKYSVEELEGRINELFRGSLGSVDGRK